MKIENFNKAREFLRSKNINPLAHVYTEVHDLTRLQALLFRLGIRALVGVRKSTGYFTAETWIHRPEKSTAGVPYWERIFSPFGFETYDDALEQAMLQGIENYEPAK